ncbi:MarR family winged helix-turn-helix transcriptional regulator [Pseudomonas syringae group sp. J309-1]|uniref:MarR family winged helix-turn-helix transcriptional regulator n=1 Tax=Pseudomonas syringae group sp. J309-1 TaxID=3079588 RepID=UPI0029070C3D|nr:MarR family transcriptional regulator [Pseudomonas syringae group sp. J309-1]MDU8362036.1 MarR family transcriptional regulator [Pseudomonas syringae group sp. J309-1]
MKHFSPDNQQSTIMGMLIGRTNSLKDRILDKQLVPYGITFSQFKVLIIVAQLRADTPAELCRHLSLDSGSMTRMLDRLEQKQLLERTRSATDRRQVQLVLTEQGRIITDQLPQIGAEAMNELLGVLDAEEVASLERILSKVLIDANDHIAITRLSFKDRGAE